MHLSISFWCMLPEVFPKFSRKLIFFKNKLGLWCIGRTQLFESSRKKFKSFQAYFSCL
nr:MAG TPA: hypothetical protein [Caudoviricetes sp.]